jgi:hypothetical protein
LFTILIKVHAAFWRIILNILLYIEKRNAYRILVGNPEGKNHWEDQDVGGWTILKLILER